MRHLICPQCAAVVSVPRTHKTAARAMAAKQHRKDVAQRREERTAARKHRALSGDLCLGLGLSRPSHSEASASSRARSTSRRRSRSSTAIRQASSTAHREILSSDSMRSTVGMRGQRSPITIRQITARSTPTPRASASVVRGAGFTPATAHHRLRGPLLRAIFPKSTPCFKTTGGLAPTR